MYIQSVVEQYTLRSFIILSLLSSTIQIFFFFLYSINFVFIRRPYQDCSHCERNQVTRILAVCRGWRSWTGCMIPSSGIGLQNIFTPSTPEISMRLTLRVEIGLIGEEVELMPFNTLIIISSSHIFLLSQPPRSPLCTCTVNQPFILYYSTYQFFLSFA